MTVTDTLQDLAISITPHIRGVAMNRTEQGKKQLIHNVDPRASFVILEQDVPLILGGYHVYPCDDDVVDRGCGEVATTMAHCVRGKPTTDRSYFCWLSFAVS